MDRSQRKLTPAFFFSVVHSNPTWPCMLSIQILHGHVCCLNCNVKNEFFVFVSGRAGCEEKRATLSNTAHGVEKDFLCSSPTQTRNQAQCKQTKQVGKKKKDDRAKISSVPRAILTSMAGDTLSPLFLSTWTLFVIPNRTRRWTLLEP